MKKRILAMVMTLAMCLSLLPVSALATNDDPAVVNGSYTDNGWVQGGTGTVTENGITVSKTAKATEEPNVFDIELKVETSTTTTVTSAAAATVLVIDLSNSMKTCATCGGYRDEWGNYYHKTNCTAGNGRVNDNQSRMEAAKQAAKDFLVAYAGDNESANRQLAIVGFGTTSKTVLSWSNVAGGAGKNSYDAAVNAINNLSIGFQINKYQWDSGGTNLEAGLFTARNLLNDTDTVGTVPVANRNVITLTDGIPTYRIDGGTGNSGSENNNTAAASQAAAIKQAGACLYTVCFGAADDVCYNGGPTVGDFLKNSIATPETGDRIYAYNADNTSDLNEAFAAITESITSGISGEGAVVTDPMSKYVILNSTPDGATASNDGFTWALSNPETATDGGTTKYVYTLTYQVTLKEDYRDGEYHPTNDVTYLTLPNGDGTINFPVPGVKAEPTRTVSFVGETASREYNGSEQALTNVTVAGLPTGYTSNVQYSAMGIDADTYDGEITAANEVKIYNAAKEDVTKSFKEITTSAGKLTITPRPITITVNDAEKFFGESDPAFTGSITSELGLVNENDLRTITYNRTNSDENSVGTYEEVLDASYTSNSNYTVTVLKGDFEIKTATAEDANLTAAGGEWPYDGDSHSATASVTGATGYTIYYKVGDGEWTTTAPSVTNVSEGTVTVSVKATKTDYTDLTCDDVTLQIKPRPITITADSASKTYDGTPLTKDSYQVTAGTLATGQKIESVTVTGSQTEVGSSDNVPSNAKIVIAMTDSDKPIESPVDVINKEITPQDVTANYDISYVNGKLTVTKRSNGGGSSKPALNKEDHYAYIVGYPDGTVQPGGNITRAEVATIFFRMLTDDSRNQFWSQTNSYSDVSEGQWFNNAISTLANAGILSGYPDGTFRPNAPITRAEFTKIAASFFERVEYTIENPFNDVDDDDWFYKFVMAAYEGSLITGYPEGDFRPNANISRAESVTIVNRTLERAPDADHFLKDMIVWPDNGEDAWYYEAVQEATNSHEYVVKGAGTNKYEEWTKILEVRDWPALEKEWSNANSATGGEVVK